MIELKALTKSYRTQAGKHYVFKNLNTVLPEGKNIALLGRNGAGKSTLMRILGGIDHADTGTVETTKRISWPLGLSGGFQGSLSGKDNVKFVCRCYGKDEEVAEKVEFVHEFSELGKFFFEPVKSYSSGMKSKLGFALSMAFEFDIYLVDEITAVGDKAFRSKSEKTFAELKGRSNLIMVSHNMDTLRAHCDSGILLHGGVAEAYDDIEAAISAYSREAA
ncbi:MAG: ABC transporter ATP-binding protein [Thiotrichales bacterium]